jgi:cyclase
VKRSLQKISLAFASIKLITLALLITEASLPAAAQTAAGETVIQKATEQFDNSPLQTTSLGNGLFLFSGDGGNVTAVVDRSSVLLIDSGIDSRAPELNDTVFQAAMRPVTRLVNTHWHFDHTGGNMFYGSMGVTVIAQENVKKQLLSPHDVPFIGLRDGNYPKQAIPTVTYSTTMALHQGSHRLTLANYGSAHTDGDTVIYIAPANVAVVGDIFSNAFYPIIDLTSGGSIDGLILSVDRILAQTNEQTRIVPGHGPVATRADLEAYRDMLVQVRERMKALITAGKTIDEATAATPTKDFDAKWGTGYVTPDVFTELVYSSLTKSSASP